MEDNRKTGYWRWASYDSNDRFGCGEWYCSECHESVQTALVPNPLWKYKYCPKCGTKMEQYSDEIKIDVAKKIWEISLISPEHCCALMDMIGVDAAEEVEYLKSLNITKKAGKNNG